MLSAAALAVFEAAVVAELPLVVSVYLSQLLLSAVGLAVFATAVATEISVVLYDCILVPGVQGDHDVCYSRQNQPGCQLYDVRDPEFWV